MLHTALQLQRIIEETEKRLSAFSEAESQERPAPDKWSRKEALGHLIDSASNNHQRFVRAQLQGELVFPGYAQESWNRAQQYQSEPWDNLVRLWASYNRHLAHVIAAIPESSAGKKCAIGDHEPVTLEFLVTDYVRHLEHHLGQIL
jgi:DinB family protein